MTIKTPARIVSTAAQPANNAPGGRPDLPHLSISGVERDTGLSKDVLRVWERRYGFPRPLRDANDERLYPMAQVEQLRTIKRLMDGGHRPGKLLALDEQDLATLASQQVLVRIRQDVGDLQHQLLELIRINDAIGLRQALAQAWMKQGLHAFVIDTVAPLNTAVGDAWMRGEIRIFQEHLYIEQVQALLRSAINAIPHPRAEPCVLLATFPDEPHGLGLLMLESLLVPEGAQCISLGTQTPIAEIAAAAAACNADAVALSFSSGYNSKLALAGLQSLRALLPEHVSVWAGGELTHRQRRALPGITATGSLAGVLPALHAWRLQRPRQANNDR
jgi:MerR family transcriptional regulator, light-induced transcriptional regulator